MMAKAMMQVGDRVHVEPVGVNATIQAIVPLWNIGKREPEKVYYDCGLGRVFEEMELMPLLTPEG
jgi:hypothetical protein